MINYIFINQYFTQPSILNYVYIGMYKHNILFFGSYNNNNEFSRTVGIVYSCVYGSMC
jgi:hypothetical protein